MRPGDCRHLLLLGLVVWLGCFDSRMQRNTDPIPRDPHLDNLEYRCSVEIRSCSEADTVLVIGRIINHGASQVSVIGDFVLSGGYHPSASTAEIHRGHRFPTLILVGLAALEAGQAREFRIDSGASVADTTEFDFTAPEFDQYPGTIDIVVSFWRWRGKPPRAGDHTTDLAECLADSIAELTIRVP